MKAKADVIYLRVLRTEPPSDPGWFTLDTLRIPYTGSGVKASAVGMHKPTFKRAMQADMIDTPRWLEINHAHSTATSVPSTALTLGFPVFFKPASGGGSLGAGIACDELELAELLETNREQAYGEYLVEEFIPGIPATIGVLEINGELTTLPVHTAETDGLSELGNLATMGRAAGISYEELIGRVLDTAFTKLAYVP